MNFTVTRLCGGKALMVIPREDTNINLKYVPDILGEEFVVKSDHEGLMLVLNWKNMDVTLYPQGKIMFYPLDDKNLAIEYAVSIFNKIRNSKTDSTMNKK
ncbi:MAG: hypothetical protein MJY64_03220 [archaeon]|nr:hypothetical protein [archaeon]